MIKHLFLDLDDTLLDFHQAERVALTKTLLHFDISPTESILDRYSALNAAQWRLLELGKLTRSEVKERRYRLLFDELGVTCSPTEATAVYEQHLAVGHYFVKGAVSLLETLQGQYHLYLASNGTLQVQKSRIQSAGIARFFDHIFISQEVGADKPNKAFFDACFAAIPHFQKNEAAIVGDSLTSDIRGGRDAGITTIWFHPDAQEHIPDILPDYTLHDLMDLPSLLRQID